MADQVINVRSGFYDAVNRDRVYTAEDMNKPYSRVVADGVFATNTGTPSTDLQVVSANDGRKVTVLAGQGICAKKWFESTTPIIIDVSPNTTLYTRIDSVIMQVDTTAAGRVGSIVYREGTPASEAAPPAINTVPGVVEYRLANITVGRNVSAITGSVISDLRGSAECPWVTGLIKQVDTSTLWQQYNDAFAEYFATTTEDFNDYCELQRESWEAFLSQLTEELTVTPNILTYTSTYTATAAATNVPINIASFDPAYDELIVYINGIFAPETMRWSIHSDNESIDLVSAIAAGDQVNFLVLKSVVTGDLQSVEAMLQEMDAKIVNQEKTVTPEMYGAIGNGVADDTAAWQAAVDSGYNVIATKPIYKCGQINVTKNITIDCGMATFISTGAHSTGGPSFDQLFVCSGEVVDTITGEADYAAFTQASQYTISNASYASYTGYAFVRGTNLFAPPDAASYGGFIARFADGKLCDTYPIAATGVTIDIVNPITVVIKNIGDIQRADSSTYTRPIEIVYGANCILENINVSGIKAYITIWINKCYGCHIDKCSIINTATLTNSYPIEITSSSFCGTTNSNIFNNKWHCWSTGGVNPRYLCYANYIDNCVMRSPNKNAILDHTNGRGTRVTNTISNSIYLHGLGEVENVTILESASKHAYLEICFEPTQHEACYKLNNVRFQIDPANSQVTPAEIHLTSEAVAAGTTYYIHNVQMRGITCNRRLASITVDAGAHSGTLIVETVNVSAANASVYLLNSNVTWTSMMLTIADMIIQSESNQVTGAFSAKANEIHMTNCRWKTLSISACTTAMLTNVYVTDAPTTLTITNLVGANIFANISDALLLAMTRVNISNLHRSASVDIYNVRKMYSAPIGLVYQDYVLDNGAWVLQTEFVAAS